MSDEPPEEPHAGEAPERRSVDDERPSGGDSLAEDVPTSGDRSNDDRSRGRRSSEGPSTEEPSSGAPSSDAPSTESPSGDEPSGGYPSGGDSTSDPGGTTGVDATDDADSSSDGEEHEPTLAGVFGGRSEDTPPRPEIRPEQISPEHALFVVLGVVLALLVLYRTAVAVFPA